MSDKTVNCNIQIAITELHKAFHIFNKAYYSDALPEPAILIQNRGNKKNTLGWCSTQKIWVNDAAGDKRYEINIVAESLNRTLNEICSTLIHEMVHLHNLVNNIKDVSRGNVYHNKKFKEVAEAHGLIITHNEKLGWSLSKITEVTENIIKESGINDAAFNLCRMDTSVVGSNKKKSNSIKYVCPKCGTSFRATKQINVICGICKEPFVIEVDEETED
jgi:hypothetical protein